MSSYDKSIKDELKKARDELRQIRNRVELILPGFKKRVKDAQKNGIKLPFLTYPDITKPIWIEEVYDNDKLYDMCKFQMERARNSVKVFSDFEKWKKDPKLRKKIKGMPQSFTTTAQLGLWMAERLLVKFENEGYLSKKMIDEHRQEIKQIRNQLREYTIKESINGNQ